jgi:hypothetical protein
MSKGSRRKKRSKIEGFSHAIKRRKILNKSLILQFGANSEFCEALPKEPSNEYGRLGKLIKQGGHFEPAEAQQATYSPKCLKKTAHLYVHKKSSNAS